MGAWGTALYSNDTASDIRGDYKPGYSQPDIFCHFRQKHRNTHKNKCCEKGFKSVDSSTSLSFIKL